MNLVLIGYVAVIGSLEILKQQKNTLINRFSSSYISSNISSLEAIVLYMDSIKNDLISYIEKKSIRYINPKKGGILTALWTFGEENNIGFRYSLKKINIKQITIEISDYFDINPYRLYSGTEILCLMSDENYNDFLDNFYHKNNIDFIKLPTTKIGLKHDKKSRIRSDIETASFLTKCYRDELDKIIKLGSKNA